MGSAAVGIFMLGLAGVQMGVTVGASGYKSEQQSQQLRDSIKQQEAAVATYKAKFAAVAHGMNATDEAARAAYQKSLDDIHQLALLSFNAKSDFQEEYQNIQKAGLIFVTIIFFLLLLKQMGVLDALAAAIDRLFSRIFRSRTKST